MRAARAVDDHDYAVRELRAEKANAKPEKKPRPKSAKERTVPMPFGALLAEQVNHAEPLVEKGPMVFRVVDAQCIHYRLDSKRLCDGHYEPFTRAKPHDLVGLGTCQACRAEASRIRAVVRR